MDAVQRFATVFALVLVLAQLTTAAPQPEGLVQLKGRDTIPPPPVMTNGGYHYAPGVDMNDDSFTTPAPPVIQSMTKDLVHPRLPSDIDDDSFTMSPPPTIQNGGLHFAPNPTSPSDGDTFATPAAPTITTMENRPPIIITGMSQLITSHVPVLTICPLPLPGPFVPSASGFPTAAYNSSTPPISSGILHPRQLIASRPVPVPPIKTAPFPSLHSANISCSISYTPTTTPVCHTALSPLAAPVIPITACDQSVAFSSEYGYRLVPGKSASVETLTTCFVAPWQDLHPGMVPTGNVLAVVCSSGRTDCTTESEFWEGTITETYTTGFTTVDFEATITWPANVIAGELTSVAVSGTERTTVSISTMMETTQTGTGLGIRRGSTATKSIGDGVGNVMTTVLHATTRTMALPGTSGSQDVDG